MSPDRKMANIYRRLAVHLGKNIKTAIELARQAQEFAENVLQQEVDQKKSLYMMLL